MKKPPARRPSPADGHVERDDNHPVVAAEWHGPLPPPGILADFNDVVENGAERIMHAWEKETKHRHALESRDLWLVGIDALLGKILAFFFVLIALGLCGFAIYKDAQWVAAVLGSGVIASVVWAFVKVNRPTRN